MTFHFSIKSLWLKLTISLLWLTGFVSCNAPTKQSSESGDTLKLKYATLLEIVQSDSFTLATVKNPWVSNQPLHRYILIDRKAPMPHQLPQGTIIRTPLQRVVTLSSVHASLLQQLHLQQSIVGLSDVPYIINQSLRNAVTKGDIADMGNSMSPNIEKIAYKKPDALFVSPFENGGYGALEKCGIPLIECADYLETSALGRAEWMRLFGFLFDCRQTTDSMFQAIEKHYLQLTRLVQKQTHHPRVLFDKKEGAVWFVPGKKSTIGQMVIDAGGCYPFDANEKNGSMALTFEKVFMQASNTDLWFIKYGAPNDLSYASLLADNAMYAKFNPFKTKKIYGCNTLKVPFFEEEPFRPDLLLCDFIKLLHPQLLPHYSLRYYTPLS